MDSLKVSRRDFLRVTGLGSAALLIGNRLDAFGLSAFNREQRQPFKADAEIALTATDTWRQILPGAQTRVYHYEGKLLNGSGVTFQDIPGSYLGPVLRVKSGTKVRISIQNKLLEDTTVHPHGPRVPEDCDGHPMQSIKPGETKVYEFQMIDRAGPYWFHPHPHMRTSEQVMMGLAGLMYVWDEDEELAVPGASTGANDLPVVIQDRAFDANNQILYNPNIMWGFLGDRILVNGQPNAAFSLEPRAYRLRLLNGSNARTYKLAWSNNMPLTVIGADGGLLPAAETRNYLMLMPGERIDLWADFSLLAGKQVFLRSLAFEAGGMGMMGGMGGMGNSRGGGMMGGMGGIANGSAFDILTVNVGNKASAKPELGRLPALSVRYDASNVPNYASPKQFVLSMGHMMTWTINGRVFEMEAVAPDENVNMDETMAWEWVNSSPIPHPMHIHNVQFQVLQRTSPGTAVYAAVNQGFVDSGWKDTVSVWPGERVKTAMKFGPHAGMYMYHCHILEHEDMTMMRNLMVMDSGMPGM
jgi:FtsP/CotA-like multicopper oxidase with cupredoxin domain